MKLSVVIPTHNRAEILKTTLQKVLAQEGVEFEVIVVDDGSMDETENTVSSLKREFQGIQIKYIKQEASHQGVARNRGFEAAANGIVVFIGDDIFVEPGFLKTHHDAHEKNPDEEVVVLGFTTWDPALEVNDYMRFLESSGWQFGYSSLVPGFVQNAEPYKYFYTSNISFKKNLFDFGKFDEQFKVYGWEDIELGYRLWKQGKLRLFYEPSAKAFHHHFLTEEDLPKKMRAVGQSAVHFERLHPEVDVVPKGPKLIALKILSSPAMLSFWKFLSPTLHFKFWSWSEFLEGAKGNSPMTS
jgi:glycosyltransferase involved in cell wall biosynthesis